MTNKDLNLDLDQNLIKPADTHANHPQRSAAHPHPETASSDSAIDNSAAPPNHDNNQHSEGTNKNTYLTAWLTAIKGRPAPWLNSGLIVLNLLFLLLASFWLANLNHQVPNDSSPSLTENATLGEFNQQLLALQAKVGKIELTLHEQQSLLATSSKDLSHQIQQLGTQLEAITLADINKLSGIKKEEPKPSKETPKPVVTKPTTDWYVNIGTFSSKEAALRLKKQLLTLGHIAQINTTSFDNKPAYRVQLPGFKDRESAELAARQIMGKTNLNGLWAWKDEQLSKNTPQRKQYISKFTDRIFTGML